MKALPGAFINTGTQSLNAQGGQGGKWAPQLLQPSTGPGKLGRRKKGCVSNKSTRYRCTANYEELNRLATILGNLIMAVYFTNHRLVKIWRRAANRPGSCRLWR